MKAATNEQQHQSGFAPNARNVGEPHHQLKVLWMQQGFNVLLHLLDLLFHLGEGFLHKAQHRLVFPSGRAKGFPLAQQDGMLFFQPLQQALPLGKLLQMSSRRLPAGRGFCQAVGRNHSRITLIGFGAQQPHLGKALEDQGIDHTEGKAPLIQPLCDCCKARFVVGKTVVPGLRICALADIQVVFADIKARNKG